MKLPRSAALLGIIGLVGCYHATIETGLTPSTVTVEKAWASSWIYGLVPPSAVSTAAKCTTGVAKVETQLPFVNMLVGAITFGIYTPMSIKVTCASKSTASLDSSPTPSVTMTTDTPEARAAALTEAVRLSRKLKSAVLVYEVAQQE